MTSAVRTRDLERELKAAELVREQVRALVGEDLALIRDSVEGQTSLFEIMSVMAEADGEEAALVEGIATYIKKLQDRKKRIEERIEIRRALMANALDVAALPGLVTAAGTITRKALPPKVIVVEEADIPARFYVPQEPKLDRTALLGALKERAAAIAEITAELGSLDYNGELAKIDARHPPIPGATLSNGGTTIQIRR
jgi:hypothetical protein